MLIHYWPFLSFANAALMLVTEDGNDCQEQPKAFQVHILPRLHSQQQSFAVNQRDQKFMICLDGKAMS